MGAVKKCAFLAVVALAGCAGANDAPSAASTTISFGWSPAFIGTASSSCTIPSDCMRPPAFNFEVPVSQSGNVSSFSVTTSDAAIADGAIVMTGPGGQGDPAVSLIPKKAGSAVLTITGLDGASAALPVTITTISTLTITLNGLPTAKQFQFTFHAPPGSDCPGFEGGYTQGWDVAAPPAPTVIRNFPAMGNGPSGSCIFSTVDVQITDAANTTLLEKAITLPIVLARDNPIAITLP